MLRVLSVPIMSATAVVDSHCMLRRGVSVVVESVEKNVQIGRIVSHINMVEVELVLRGWFGCCWSVLRSRPSQNRLTPLKPASQNQFYLNHVDVTDYPPDFDIF
jgi:hypothetical protein